MSTHHLIRIGVFGHVGRFNAADGSLHPRGSRVVCRTARGLEVGEVLNGVDGAIGDIDGLLLRRLTGSDHLLLERIERNRRQAFAACRRLLDERRLDAVLMDVELLFDGRSLYFYFLGEPTAELDAITDELAEAYDAEVQFRRFAQTLVEGCGPSCGTEEAAGGGCGTGGCVSCAVATACGKGQR